MYRLAEFKEIEFIVKCCYPRSLVCFVIYSTSYRKGKVCFRFMMAVQVSVCECEYFTLPLLPYLLLASPSLFTPSTDYYQRLTLESWFTNLEQMPLKRSQQLPAPYKRLIDEIK